MSGNRDISPNERAFVDSLNSYFSGDQGAARAPAPVPSSGNIALANRNPVTEKDLKVFVDSIGNFFSQLDSTPAEVRAAFLNSGSAPLPTHDFTGIIELSGAFRGSVAFSAPRVMLRRVMMCLQEPAQTDADFLDATGEIANIFAGNARRHFGEDLEISVPRIHAGPLPQSHRQRGRTVVIVISWMGYKASVLVDLERVQ